MLCVLMGCSVGPNYRAPKVALPKEWAEVGQGGTTNSAAELARWWTVFGDPVLDSLIERAVE
jgi:outer membrane protein TolC